WAACKEAWRTFRRSVPRGKCGPCFSRMPNGSKQVPLDSWMASRKSAAVNSSHFTESLDCAWMEQANMRDRSREQITARFIDLPPEPPCILALFHVLEPPLFGLDSEAEDDNDLHEEKTDHQTEHAANPVRVEQGDGQEGRENRRTETKGVADSRSPQTDLRREQFRNVNREERGK